MKSRVNKIPGKDRPAAASASVRRVLQTLGLLLLSVLLLTLAFAPVYQFYLAWVGLVPLLLVLSRCRTIKSAFFWSWLAGSLFFAANMWWMAAITGVGMPPLVIVLGLYWGVAGLVIKSLRLLEADAMVAAPMIAAVWTAIDFLRGTTPIVGLPWLYIGHTQTPILVMCQIADTLGVYGVTFWVVMINVVIALRIIRGYNHRLVLACRLVGVTLIVVVAYGMWRMNQAATIPGPTVMVVQSNYPQSNKGEKGATDEELLDFHVTATHKAVAAVGGPGRINLSVWSETMMPALNSAALHEEWGVLHTGAGSEINEALISLHNLSATDRIGLLVGGHYWDDFGPRDIDGKTVQWPNNSRNTAYLFQPDGSMDDAPGKRYDKFHIVPFGEYIPFQHSIPPLYRLLLSLGPKYYFEYQLQDGSDNGLTVFNLQNPAGGSGWRFVSPICFEDIDPRICSAMFRPGADGKKRADFLVNITNDGWFLANENVQHLQAATFRSIENRVPTARSVNTGVSGFIDSLGRTSRLLDARIEGTSVMQLTLDDRLTMYTRYGDFFAWLCVAAAVGYPIWQKLRRSRQTWSTLPGTAPAIATKN